MRTSREPSGPSCRPSGCWHEDVLFDDLVDGYIEWRVNARAVAEAYARWSFASGTERAMRFAAYLATLDQEQETAAAYAQAAIDVERWLERSPSDYASRSSS